MKRFGLAGALVMAVGLLSAGPALAGDAANGEKVYKKCKACHALEEGKHKVGPSLAGIVGKPAGAAEGYKYSKAMAESSLVWDEATLDGYLEKPRSFLKGTKMSFAGLKKEEDRADVIEFLKQN